MESVRRECERLFSEARRLVSRAQDQWRWPSSPDWNYWQQRWRYPQNVSRFFQIPSLPPLTTNSVVNIYLPYTGMTAYSILSVNVMHPTLFTRMFPKQDITNILLLTSFSGTSAWLWRRPHIAGTLPSRRFPWVFLGSSMFTLGSVLMWAIIRSTIGRHPTFCIMLGLTSGAVFSYSAVDYFKYLDKDFEPLEEIMDGANHSDEDKYDIDL